MTIMREVALGPLTEELADAAAAWVACWLPAAPARRRCPGERNRYCAAEAKLRAATARKGA
jgi:hypothetical protein